MKKIRQLAVTSLLVSTVSLSLPLQADIVGPVVDNAAILSDSQATLIKKPSVTNSVCDGTVAEEMLCLTLQHRFNGGEPQNKETILIPFEKVDENPLVLLAELKKHFSQHLKKHEKPLEIDTTVDFLLPSQFRDLGRWPSVSIKTVVDSKGEGKSDVVFPAYRREVPAKSGKHLIDWKALRAQFTFTGQFDNLTVALNTPGLRVEKPGEMTLSVGVTTFNGAFDANLEPTQIDLNLPSFTFQDEEGSLNTNNLVFKLNTDKSSKGVRLDDLDVKVGHLDLSSQIEQSFKISLDNLTLTTDTVSQGDVLNYSVTGKIGKITLPKDITENLEITSVAGQLAIQQIDEAAWLALQNATPETAESGTDKSITPLLMLGQFMEEAAKFVPKSPEIALTEFIINTSQGDLEADVNFGVDGKKVISLETPFLIIPALWASVEFKIDKTLLNTIVEMMITHELQKKLPGKVMSQQELAQIRAMTMQQFPFNLLVEGKQNKKKLVADLKEGMLTLNEQQIPLFQLLFSFLETQ